MKKVDLIDVNADNVSDLGFFCCMSRRKSEGYQKKLNWLAHRFDEGMRIKMLGQGARGFIEYIPGEYAWRAVNAKGYLFIHCLWVVGKSKGKGFAGRLLESCIEDATRIITQVAAELGIQSKVIEFGKCKDVQQYSPSPYGVFNVVYAGKLLSYHYLTQKEIQRQLREAHL